MAVTNSITNEGESDAANADRAGKAVSKRPTGIKGFDEITGGGLPENRLTAILGSAGAGKTVFALQVLVNRLLSDGQACIFVSFEEPVGQIRSNAASFDWGVNVLTDPRLTFVEARIPLDAELAGPFDLSALLAGLTALRAETGACNIVFDGIDVLLSSLRDEWLEREELSRLDRWVRDTQISALVTVKSFGISDRDQLRSDFLQFMTDCVVVFESTISQTAVSRTLRVAKYRGSGFAVNPVPVVIGRSGIELVVIRGFRSSYPTFSDRVSTGITRLDAVLSGGYLHGSSILVSGSPGTSKSSLAASFVLAACQRGDKALFVSFDESGLQIITNMRSIGIDLLPFVDTGQLVFESLLSSGRSPEEHFVRIRDVMELHSPACLVVDPISSLLRSDFPFSTLICEMLLDHAKSFGITVLCTSLLGQVSGDTELSASHVSTLADTWIHVSYVAYEGERNRALTIIKSRGSNHSNQVREVILSSTGINLVDVYVAEGEVLMGSARAQKEDEEKRRLALQETQGKQRRIGLDREVAELETRVRAAVVALELKKQESEFLLESEQEREELRATAAMHRLELRRSLNDLAPIPFQPTQAG